MLSIFNNGSQLWILFLIMLGWAAYWGWKTYKSHKSGYHRQNKDGTYTDVKPTLMANQNFWFGIAGVVAMAVFMWLINSDYL